MSDPIPLDSAWQADDARVGADPVNPPHYKAHPSGVECIDVAEHMNFNRGNALKYLWRAGLKGCALEDLRKARWYLDREIVRVEREAG
jgi:uncharacterized protein DUF3310